MSTRAIATSTLWQMASQLIMAALSIVTVKFISTGLALELAGNYNSAYGYLQLFGILADFGLYAVSVREVSRAPSESTDPSVPTRTDMLSAMIALRILILLVSLGSALVLVWALPLWRGTPLPMSVTIASLVPFFTLLAGVLRTIFQVNYKMQYVFIAEVLQRIITTGLIGFFVLRGVVNSTDLTMLYLFLSIGGAGAFVLFVLSFIFGRRFMPIRLVFHWKLIRELALLAAPYGIAYLCIALYRQSDVTMIALLRPDYELQNAYYGFVQRMMDMAYLLPTFLLNSTLPLLAERDARGDDTESMMGKTFFLILLIGSVALLFAALWPRPLTALLTRPAYLSTAEHPGSDNALFLLSIPMFCNGIILFAFYTLLTRHRWKPLVRTLGIGVALAFISNLILIPRFGFIGAAYTSNIVHISLSALLLPQAFRTLPTRLTKKQLLQWIAFSVLLALFLVTLRPFLTRTIFTVGALLAASLWMVLLAWILNIHGMFFKETVQSPLSA